MEDGDKTFHGKYEGCRDVHAVMKYCMKEGDYISSYTNEELDAIKKAKKNKNGVIGELILAEGISANVIK